MKEKRSKQSQTNMAKRVMSKVATDSLTVYNEVQSYGIPYTCTLVWQCYLFLAQAFMPYYVCIVQASTIENVVM